MNFKHDCDLTKNFYTINGLSGHYFGFYFENACDKEAFTKIMKQLNGVLRKKRHEVTALRDQIAVMDMTIDQIE